MYPSVMQLFWERLKPATQTESFLESAIAISERVYRGTSDWYLPSYQIDVNEAQRHQIQRPTIRQLLLATISSCAIQKRVSLSWKKRTRASSL
jgi:hypothetical protein